MAILLFYKQELYKYSLTVQSIIRMFGYFQHLLTLALLDLLLVTTILLLKTLVADTTILTVIRQILPCHHRKYIIRTLYFLTN